MVLLLTVHSFNLAFDRYFQVLCLNNWIEQVEILSHVYAAVMEHPMLDQVSSVVSVLLHKYFYCSMAQKELVLQVGSLAWTPF